MTKHNGAERHGVERSEEPEGDRRRAGSKPKARSTKEACAPFTFLSPACGDNLWGGAERLFSPMNQPFCIARRLRSFGHAFAGIFTVFCTQQNAWIHALATVAVVVTGFLLKVSAADWCWLVAAMALVWMAECFNTAIEFLADVVSPEFHPLVKKAKNIAAGAVLIAAIGAVIIGLLVFLPYLS